MLTESNRLQATGRHLQMAGHGSDDDGAAIRLGEPEDPRGNGRQGQGGRLQRLGAGQSAGHRRLELFLLVAFSPHGADSVDYETARQRTGASDDRLAHRYRREPVRLLLDDAATPADDRPGDASSMAQARVGGIDDRVHRLGCEVSNHDLDPPIAELDPREEVRVHVPYLILSRQRPGPRTGLAARSSSTLPDPVRAFELSGRRTLVESVGVRRTAAPPDPSGGNGYNPQVAPTLAPALMALCLVNSPQLVSDVGRRSLPWLPPDLARQVVKHERDFNRGAAAAAGWPAEYHLLNGPNGLARTLPAHCERLVAALKNRAPFSEVVAGMGVLAHMVVDLGSPFLGNSGSQTHGQAFVEFAQSRSTRIPFVFYGQSRALINGPVAGIDRLVDDRRRAAAPLLVLVRDDMDRAGGPAGWRRLDDRSSTFGAASVVVNHAATDFANMASWVWLNGGGLVPPIRQPEEAFLVWRGEPQPREAPRPRLGFRQKPSR